jgi:branched-chain amino acid transport system ATP-binding protein
MAELTVTGLCAGYGGMRVVNGIDLSLCTGEVVSLVGCNGAGKTTALQAVAGIRFGSSAGHVRLDGKDITRWSAAKMASLGLALVPEGHRIFAEMSVYENLRLGAFSVRRDKHAIGEQLEQVFELFPDLQVARDRSAEQLSGGQQQMLAIGAALMCRPQFLLLDEPCAGLAPALVDRIYDVVEKLAASGHGVLLVEQDVQRAMRRSDRTYVMDQGDIVTSGPSSTLINDQRVLDLVRGAIDGSAFSAATAGAVG